MADPDFHFGQEEEGGWGLSPTPPLPRIISKYVITMENEKDLGGEGLRTYNHSYPKIIENNVR